MAILATLFALGSRFAGKILTTALGWASTLLFGRVPAERQIFVLGITFGSVIWLVLLAGVLFPDIGTFLLVLVPPQEFVPEAVIRLVMVIAALIVPGVVGALTAMLAAPSERTPARIARSIARGYPLTILLAVLLIFLAGLSVYRRIRSLLKRWTDAHVPIVVKPGFYDDVARDLDEALSAAGLDLVPRAAPAAMSKPAKWLARIAGPDATSLVPDQMMQLHGPELDILVYPMDLLISGKEPVVNRARAAMASRLTTSAAHLTTTGEAQALEDRLAGLLQSPAGQRPRYDDHAERELAAIDEELATIPVRYEEWEVLFRQRLQVERDLRVGAMAGENVVGAEPVEAPGGAQAALSTLGRWARAGAEAVAEAATDERTSQVIDRMARGQWRWAARAASVAVVAAREALRAPGPTDPDDAIVGERDAGEPASFGDQRGAAVDAARSRTGDADGARGGAVHDRPRERARR